MLCRINRFRLYCVAVSSREGEYSSLCQGFTELRSYRRPGPICMPGQCRKHQSPGTSKTFLCTAMELTTTLQEQRNGPMWRLFPNESIIGCAAELPSPPQNEIYIISSLNATFGVDTKNKIKVNRRYNYKEI